MRLDELRTDELKALQEVLLNVSCRFGSRGNGVQAALDEVEERLTKRVNAIQELRREFR